MEDIIDIMKKVIQLTTLLLGSTFAADSLGEAFNQAKVEGQIRLGAVQSEDDAKKKRSTLALGGELGIKTKAVSAISLGATFYTTNALFGKNSEGMFLGSEKKSYSIVGEAYIQAQLGNSMLRAGRQIIDTPFADSDDIGMIPNTFEGYSLLNQDLPDTKIILAKLDRWSGIDSEIPERFTKLEADGNGVLMAGVIYEGVENTTLQTWHYRLDETEISYAEAGYESERFNVGLQYVDQDSDNRAFGVAAGATIGDLALNAAYNGVKGVVSNGFGGGPFFTSSEDHTIADVKDQKAVMVGAEYAIDDITLACTHVEFDKGENETDYIISYAMDESLSMDIIYSDMYGDGKLTRFFVNYNF